MLFSIPISHLVPLLEFNPSRQSTGANLFILRTKPSRHARRSRCQSERFTSLICPRPKSKSFKFSGDNPRGILHACWNISKCTKSDTEKYAAGLSLMSQPRNVGPVHAEPLQSRRCQPLVSAGEGVMKNPYVSKPNHQFWRRSAGRGPEQVDPVCMCRSEFPAPIRSLPRGAVSPSISRVICGIPGFGISSLKNDPHCRVPRTRITVRFRHVTVTFTRSASFGSCSSVLMACSFQRTWPGAERTAGSLIHSGRVSKSAVSPPSMTYWPSVRLISLR